MGSASGSRAGKALFVALAVALLVIDVLVTYSVKSKPYPGANDFYSRWSGARSFWVDGLDPYGEEASLEIQVGIYGRPVLEDEDPGYFAYPFYTVFLLAPLASVEYAWAEAIWVVLLEVALLGALSLLLDLFGWRPRPWLLGVSLAWTLLFYPAARGLILGQPGLLVYFLQVLVLWALARRRDALAGVALALSTIKPQMGFLLVPILLLWALWVRRWRIVMWFAAVWGAAVALSFLALPTWFAAWFDQLTGYTSYTAIGSPVWVLARIYLPFLGPVGEAVISVALLFLVAWGWWRHVWRGDDFGWAVCLTLTVTHLIALRTATPHFVVFVIPLVFYFKLLTRAGRRRGPWAIFLIEMVLLVSLWVLFLTTVEGKFEHPVMYLPLPFGMLIVLLLTQRLWRVEAPICLAPLASEALPRKAV